MSAYDAILSPIGSCLPNRRLCRLPYWQSCTCTGRVPKDEYRISLRAFGILRGTLCQLSGTHGYHRHSPSVSVIVFKRSADNESIEQSGASCSKCYSGYSGYSPLLAVRVVGIFRLSAEKEESTHAIEKINAGAAMSIRSDAILLAHLTKVSARLWRTRVYLHVCRSTAVG